MRCDSATQSSETCEFRSFKIGLATTTDGECPAPKVEHHTGISRNNEGGTGTPVRRLVSRNGGPAPTDMSSNDGVYRMMESLLRESEARLRAIVDMAVE